MTDHTPLVTGLHHVTAFARDPRANVRFYTEVLGLRLVKRTVNFDDPLTYHLYYGDERGSPGSLLTHFPSPNAKRGRHGSPEIVVTVLGIAPGSAAEWLDRLRAHAVDAERRDDRVVFEDHDGMRFALMEARGTEEGGGVGRVEGVVIRVPDVDETAGFLRDVVGFRVESLGPERAVLAVSDQDGAQWVELEGAELDTRTAMGAGSVHHVAWRVPDAGAQARAAAALRAARIAVTPVMDRQYFRSIYFRVPAGVVFEIATDGPGFDIDEPAASLGAGLCLPSRYEPRRPEIEAHLLALD